MTVNPDAGISAPTTFHEEAIYAFRFDLDGDLREDLTNSPLSHAFGPTRRE